MIFAGYINQYWLTEDILMLQKTWICDAIRTPIGRYGGALASVRPDDLAAHVLKSLCQRNPLIDWTQLDEVIMGCANQAGEDNRNVARMASLVAGLPVSVPAYTINRLCASGLDALAAGHRQIACAEADLIIAGGVESMSRAPYVLGKASVPFERGCELFDTTMGWRFINPLLKNTYGAETMPETGENVARDYKITRKAQDTFALRSQQRATAAQQNGLFGKEITPLMLSLGKGKNVQLIELNEDEHIRPQTTLEGLGKLKPLFKEGTLSAGNSSGLNDGACALILASSSAVDRYNLEPRARILGAASAGVAPRIMGMGPVPAIIKLLSRLELKLKDMDVIELNEAFASQAIAVLKELGIPADDERVNPNGGAIAMGHPLGMTGSRLVTTAINQLERTQGRYALCTMCVGVGQGVAMVIERVS
jgi:3-oxoadipyl-CoA thiolase